MREEVEDQSMGSNFFLSNEDFEVHTAFVLPEFFESVHGMSVPVCLVRDMDHLVIFSGGLLKVEKYILT